MRNLLTEKSSSKSSAIVSLDVEDASGVKKKKKKKKDKVIVNAFSSRYQVIINVLKLDKHWKTTTHRIVLVILDPNNLMVINSLISVLREELF